MRGSVEMVRLGLGVGSRRREGAGAFAATEENKERRLALIRCLGAFGVALILFAPGFAGRPVTPGGRDLFVCATASSSNEDFEGDLRGYDGDGLGAGSTGDGSDYDIGADEYVPRVTYRLTVGVTGDGEVDPPKGTHSYDKGRVVRVEATSASDWTFDHWEGNLAGAQNPAYLTMDADKSVTAVFVAKNPADINLDGTTDALDVQLVINAALGMPIGGLDADINRDGEVNALDVQLVVNAVLGISAGGA